VYVLDETDQSIKEYSTADEPEAFYKIRLPGARALVVPYPGVLWVLDGRQRKVFAYRPGGALTEFIDLKKFCNYEAPSGLAWDRRRGILYICFAHSQRIVGLVEAAAGMIEQAEPPGFVPSPSAMARPYRSIDLPSQSSAEASSRKELPVDSTADVPPAAGRDQDPANDRTPSPRTEVPSPYPGSTFIVKPPYPPTIYVLPLILRENPVRSAGPRPRGPHGTALSACAPDLAISDLEVLSLSGRRITFRYRVSNTSGVPVNLDGVIVHALVSADHLRNTGDKLVADHIFYEEFLGPGQSRCLTDTGVLRKGLTDRPFLIVDLDTADRLAESNEENNATVTLTLFAGK
jgi:hypothetical protein